MKSQKFKRIIVLLLVTAMAVAIPGSFAKYVGRQNYKMSVKLVRSFFYNTYIGMNTKDYKVTLPYPGRYAIIVKGGDGANGRGFNFDKEIPYDIEGGLGGLIVGVYTATQSNQIVYAAPGSAGTRANYSTSKGSNEGKGGQNNNATVYNGGAGATNDGSLGKVGETISPEPSGSGGGAASAVYLGESNKGELLAVAGGGGGAAGWNERFVGGSIVILGQRTYRAGDGGNAASNFVDGVFASTDVRVVKYGDSKYNVLGKIYYGSVGTGNTKNLGGSGTLLPGIGATSDAVLGVWSKTAGDGTTSGTGGIAAQYGGGGGAGYTGGGGGAGTSITVAAGGGGGGSSFISDLLVESSDNVDYLNIIDEAKERENPIPEQFSNGDYNGEGDGYIIIKYLGPANSETNSYDRNQEIAKYILEYYKLTTTNTLTNNDTSNAAYKSLMGNSVISSLLNGRLWTLTIESNNPVLYFSDQTGLKTKDQKVKVWRFKNGQITSCSNITVARSGIYNAYKYSLNNPSSGTYNADTFVFS